MNECWIFLILKEKTSLQKPGQSISSQDNSGGH